MDLPKSRMVMVASNDSTIAFTSGMACSYRTQESSQLKYPALIPKECQHVPAAFVLALAGIYLNMRPCVIKQNGLNGKDLRKDRSIF